MVQVTSLYKDSLHRTLLMSTEIIWIWDTTELLEHSRTSQRSNIVRETHSKKVNERRRVVRNTGEEIHSKKYKQEKTQGKRYRRVDSQQKIQTREETRQELQTSRPTVKMKTREGPKVRSVYEQSHSEKYKQETIQVKRCRWEDPQQKV